MVFWMLTTCGRSSEVSEEYNASVFRTAQLVSEVRTQQTISRSTRAESHEQFYFYFKKERNYCWISMVGGKGKGKGKGYPRTGHEAPEGE